VVAIYIVLGIAADDIFVFYDAWRQSEHLAPEIIDTTNKRMAYAWRRAFRAMAVTSVTTSVAFFANALSSLMPIRVFGIFSGIIIPLNYLLVVMMMPPAAIILEKYNFHRCCCCPCGLRKPKDPAEEKPAKGELGTIERIFDTHINSCVSKFKWPIVVVSVAWFVVAAVFAAQVGPMTKPEEFISPDHPLMKPIKLITEEFGEKEAGGTAVSVYWGAAGVDDSEDDPWDPEWRNAPVFDKDLNVAPQANQLFLKQFCADLRAQTWTLPKGFKCWINEFETWVKTAKPSVTLDGRSTEVNAFPVPETAFDQVFKQYLTSPKGYQQFAGRELGYIRY